jgi:hypothetical protein
MKALELIENMMKFPMIQIILTGNVTKESRNGDI